MIGSDIQIANRLEVLLGNVIIVPGCEPTSAISSPTLAVNSNCRASTIPLATALEAIPGSTIEIRYNPMRWFFVLPAGPPTQPGCNTCVSTADYYQMLRDAAPPVPPQEDTYVAGQCDPFPLGGCA